MICTRVGCTVSKNRSFALQSSTFGVLCEMQWRIRFRYFFPFSKFFSYQELRVKKGGAPRKVKIFFSTGCLVLKRSIFDKQKQCTKKWLRSNSCKRSKIAQNSAIWDRLGHTAYTKHPFKKNIFTLRGAAIKIQI